MIVPSSRLLLLACAAALPVAALAGYAPALVAPGAAVLLLLAILAAADAILGASRAARLDAHTQPLSRLTKDSPAILDVNIENRTAREMRVAIALPMPSGLASEKSVEEIAVPPGTSRLGWRCTPGARGDFRIEELHLEIDSPLGLWALRVRRPLEAIVRVYPNLRDRATAALFRRTADLGFRRRPRLGKGREFENLRHYASGDNYEDIDWKATARRGMPVVKLYQIEHAQEVYAILDASRLSARPGIMDGYVGAALHLALIAQRQGDRFGLATFTNHVRCFLRARSGLGHFRLCRETIYNLYAERVSPDFSEVFTTLQLSLRRRALLVFFTSLDDPLLAETFGREIPLLARRHLVLVNVTETAEMRPLFQQDPPLAVDALYGGLTAQMLRNRMHEVQLALQNKGVKLALVDPARLKQRVTAQYLEVKRRQAL
jgi:uncharacterized protein (DUF58 family)